MIRFLIIILIAFSLPITITAQNANVYWGNEFGKLSDYNTQLLHFIKEDSLTNSTLWLRSPSNRDWATNLETIFQLFIEKFDSENNIVYSQDLMKIMLPDKNDSNIVEIQKFLIVNKRILLLTSAWNKKKKDLSFFIHEVNDRGLLNKTIKVDGIHDDAIAFQNFFKLSSDSSKLLVAIKCNGYYTINILDRDLTKISLKEIKSNNDTIHDMLFNWLTDAKVEIDNKGKIFFLVRNIFYNDKSIFLYKYDYEIDSINIFKLGIGVENIVREDYTYKINHEGSIIIMSGTYREANKTYNYNTYKGTFIVSINSDDLSIRKKKIISFPKPIYNNGYNIGADISIIEKEDKGFIIMLEKGFEEIIIDNYDKDFNVLYNTTIYKQATRNLASGYISLYDNNTSILRVMYNDNIKNLTINNEKVKKLHTKNPAPVLATIDENGKITKDALLNPSTPSVTLAFKMACQISKDKIMIYGVENKKFRLGSLFLH